jgi:hypothetical protein
LIEARGVARASAAIDRSRVAVPAIPDSPTPPNNTPRAASSAMDDAELMVKKEMELRARVLGM